MSEELLRTDPLVSITGLRKSYGRFLALDGIDLEIPRGRIVGLLGPNGCGKTTLIKLINGLLVPGRGQIRIEGKAPGIETKQIVSYLPERTYLNSGMKIRELVSCFTDFYADFQKEKALSMLEALEIGENCAMKSLSKGTKEKVQLIMVMSRRASLYILDEPIAGVDPAAREYILKTIIQDYQENASILLSTHLISDIENVLDDVIFMKEGKILLTSGAEELRQKQGKSVDAYFREVFSC